VWLDRGELDKIIERVPVERSPVERIISTPYEERRDVDEYERSGHRRYKRKSLLADLFDFD
jgi:Zn-finger nucleic acid-binding protein